MTNSILNRRARLAGTTALAAILCTTAPASADGRWANIVNDAIAETSAPAKPIKVVRTPGNLSALKRKPTNLTVKLDLDGKAASNTSSFASALPARTVKKSAKALTPANTVPPRASIQLQGGNDRSIATVDLFAPVFQTGESVTFVDIRGVATTEDEFEGNFGIGYRQTVGEVFGEEAVIGAYGFFDIRRSPNDFTYYQGTGGIEFLTDTFELRANGYLPNNDVNVVRAGQNFIQLNGTTLQQVVTNQIVEFALPGFDIEAGVNFDLADDLAVRATGGYFHFERDGLRANGPKGRLELEYSDPFGLDGFVLTAGAEIRDDELRGTDTSGFLRLSIPLGADPTPRRDLSDRAKKLGRYVFRDVDILAPTKEDEGTGGTSDLVGGAIDGNSAPGTPSAEGETLNLYHVADTPQGAADCTSAANACTVAVAQADANYGPGDTLIVVDSGGSSLRSNIELNADLQNVVGADAAGNAVITLADAAGSTIALSGLGGRVTIEGTITPFNSTTLERFNIDGGKGDAIRIDKDLGPVGVTVRDVDIIGGEIGVNVLKSANGVIRFDNASSISGVRETAFMLAAPTFESTFEGSIQHTGFGPSINVQNHFNGDVSFTGLIEIDSIGTATGLAATEDAVETGSFAVAREDVFRSRGSVNFSNADSTYNISGPITLNNANGGVSINSDSAGTFTFGDITGSSFGPTFSEDGGTANVTVNGAVQQTGSFGSIINIEDKTGGSTTFAGPVSGDLDFGNGVVLESNIGTISFTGGIDISTTQGAAFTAFATGGLSVSGGTNALTTNTGLALNLNSNTISADGVSFDTITSTGTTNRNTPVTVSNNGGGDIGLGAVSIAGTASEDSLETLPVAPGAAVAVADIDLEPLFIDGVFITGNGSSITASSMTIDNVSGDAIEIASNPGTVTIDTVDIDGSGEAAVFVTKSDGTVIISGGTVGSSSSNEFGLAVLGGAGDITFGADITQNGSGDAVSIESIAGGTIDVTGTISTDAHSDATGVFLADNTGGTVTFDGDMTLAGTGGGIIALDNSGGTFTFNGFVDVDNAASLRAPLSELELAPLGVALLNTEELPEGAIETAPAEVELEVEVEVEVEPAPIPGPTYNFLGGLDVNVAQGVAFIAADLNEVLGPQITVNTTDISTNRITTDTGIAVEMIDVNVGDTGFNLASIDAGVSEATPVLFAGVTGGNVRVGNVTIAGTAGEFLIKEAALSSFITKDVIPVKLVAEPLDAMVVADSSAIFDFTLVTIGTETTGASGDGLVLLENTGNITVGSVDINNGLFDGLFIEDAAGTITINGGNIGGTNVNGGSLFIADTEESGTINLNNLTVVANTNFDEFAAVDDPFLFEGHPVIENNAGTITTTGGSFTNSGSLAALEITGNSGTINIGSTIVNTADGPSVFGVALDIDTITDGTVTVTGDVTRNGEGVAVAIGDLFFPDGGLTGGTVNINGAVTASNGATIEIDKIGADATVNFNGPVSVTDTGFGGIFIKDVDGALNFNGTGENGTNITGGMFAGAITTTGNIGGTVSFADVDVTVNAGSPNGVIDLADTSITGTFSINDLDIETELPDDATESLNRAGIDLSGTTGGGTIRLGDNTVTDGESASIGAGLSIGVLTSDTTNVNFTFGDGEGDIDKGSTIDADVAISANPGPAGGTYNFEDVLFDDAAEFDFPAGDEGAVLFVASTATGDGSGKDLDNLITAGGADSVTGAATIVLVNDGNTISTDSNGFNLEDGQNIDGFGNGNTITVGTGAPEGFTGVPGSKETFTHNGGAATLQGGERGTIQIGGSSSIENVNISSSSNSIAAISTAQATFTDAEIILRDLSLTQTGFARAIQLGFDNADTGVEVVFTNVDVFGNSEIDRFSFLGGNAADIKVSISNSSLTGALAGFRALDIRGSSIVGANNLELTVTDFSNNRISGANGGGGIRFEGVNFAADNPGAVQGGTLVIGQDFNDRIQGDGIRIDSSAGIFDINSLTVFAEELGLAPLGLRNNSPGTLTVNVGSENIDTFVIP